jgi:hypothetical protein
MRTIKFIFTLLLVALVVPLASRAAQGGGTTVRAILVIASKEKGAPDPRLSAYESYLRSALRFESYRFVRESSKSVPAGGRATLNLQGNNIELESRPGGGVFVTNGDTRKGISPGGPGVVFLAGSAGGKGEVYGIIVLAE